MFIIIRMYYNNVRINYNNVRTNVYDNHPHVL